MHPAGRQQAQKLRRAARRFGFGDRTRQRGQGEERAVFDPGVDAHEVLHDHAAGAEIHVPDLGIAHLTGRQTDMAFGGLQEGRRMQPAQAVQIGSAGKCYGIFGALDTMAEPVQDAENDGVAAGHGKENSN
jgi:hypothetical protein